MNNKLTKQFLILEYKTKSVVKIAKELGIPNTCMYRLFDKYNISRRTQKEAGKLRIVEHNCIECGKPVSRKEYKRCASCEHKRKHKDYFCKICNTKISNGNGLTGKGRCQSCANKGKNNPMSGKKDVISKHHIDLNRKNNKKSNILKIHQSIHSSLHHRAYDYLVKIGLIKKYIKWFFKNLGEKK
jgi:hypothetical protein